MKSALPTFLGISAGELSRLAGVPAWLVIVVVAASLVLGLVKAIVPQDSADRLHLLLAIRGCTTRPGISSGITVTGHVMDDQEPCVPRSATTQGAPARTRRMNPATSRGDRDKPGLP